ncbi:AMP-binding protein [Paenibacillus barcinonensis]|uniref:AMP-binding protein n=1 Tax=Paenibacillus barcinonensis TaxID=198119 RepID=UPI001C0FBD7C|nr:AMP-binding protein [Paenibacillus barcinonensis]MBU5354501.1 AMP-binding protein [Paenibacillus barcinonensis]
MLLADAIRMHAVDEPEKIAICDDSRQISYDELHHGMMAAVNELLANEEDFEAGGLPLVGMLMNNSAAMIEYFLATVKIGMCAAVFDPKWSIANLTDVITECKPLVLIVDKELITKVPHIPASTRVIIANEDKPLFVANKEVAPQRSSTEESLFYMGFTSGTTGRPKGYLRSQRSWIKSFSYARETFMHSARDHVLAPGSLAYSLSLYACIQTLYFGGTFHLTRKFRAESVLETLTAHPVTNLYLVPTMFEALYKAFTASYSVASLPSVRSLITSGDKWSPESKRKVTEMFENAGLYEFYGASELSFVTVLDPEGNRYKPDSIGKPFAGVQVSIRKADHTEAAEGTVGQLFVKSPMVFSGYYGSVQETSQVLHGEWATVGDLATRDSEGYLYLVGRKKNMIISGGLNIYPEEIEKLLLTLDAVEEAIVVGVPDVYWGQKVTALIKLRTGSEISDDEIVSLCSQELASYKCPKRIIRVDTFPYTTSGKISRAKLDELQELKQ